MNNNKYSRLFTVAVFAMVMNLAGCSGDDGTDVNPATLDDLQNQLDNLAAAQNVGPESCVICHSDDGSVALSGAGHQEEYDKYTDTSALTLTVDSVSDTAIAGTSTLTFTAKRNGVGLTAAEVAALPQQRFYVSTYDSTTRKFNASFSYSAGSTPGNYTDLGGGTMTVQKTNVPFATGTGTNTQAYAYITDNALETEGMTLYDDVANAGLASTFGDADTYVSNANVAGCEGCHGTPYMKHGYRAAEVAGLSDFGGCKNCHVDTTNGTHPDWQLLKDDPARYAALNALAEACPDNSCDSVRENMTADELAKYQYNRSLMNDVHMAHNMEFPYPQSMKNCNTCHEDNLTTVLTDENYTAETCISCHAIDSLIEKMSGATAILFHDTFIPANIDDPIEVDYFKSIDCSDGCHKAGGYAPVFSKIHNGYDAEIYADATTGTKYSEAFVVTVDDASLTGNILTIEFHAVESPDIPKLAVTDIVPTVMVGLYGYNTKHYIIGPHNRDFDDNGDGVVGERNVDSTNLEYVVGQEHPRFTTVSASGGAWVVTADLSAWADKIADGTIKRAEIGVMPELDDADGEEVAMNAPSRTFDLGANAFDDDYFPDVVKVDGGCNNCHDALATTFHSGKRGGNIKICKMCHVPSSGGSHLEMQSRSIDSYVHAIHSFQAFDIGDIDFSDPVEALEYEHHIVHVFPNFTIKNCESCHNEGTYGVPDQSKSLSSVSSGSDSRYHDFTDDDIDNPTLNLDRNIGTVPSVVTGPASRACGSCHRADMIKEDDAGTLAAFNEHTKVFGYLVLDDDSIWDTVVEKIMSMF